MRVPVESVESRPKSSSRRVTYPCLIAEAFSWHCHKPTRVLQANFRPPAPPQCVLSCIQSIAPKSHIFGLEYRQKERPANFETKSQPCNHPLFLPCFRKRELNRFALRWSQFFFTSCKVSKLHEVCKVL